MNVFGFSVLVDPETSWEEQMKKSINQNLLDQLFSTKKEKEEDLKKMEDPFDTQLILQMFSSMLFSNRITPKERQTIGFFYLFYFILFYFFIFLFFVYFICFIYFYFIFLFFYFYFLVEGFLKLFLSSRLKSSKCISIITNEFWKETENSEIKRCVQAILPYLIHVGKTMKTCFENSIFDSLKIFVFERVKYVATIDPSNQFRYLIQIAEGNYQNDSSSIVKQEKLIKEEKDLSISSSSINSTLNDKNTTSIDISNVSFENSKLPGSPLHNSIAFQICSQIQFDPQGIYSCLSHVLPLLRLDTSQESIYEKIKNKTQTLTEVNFIYFDFYNLIFYFFLFL